MPGTTLHLSDPLQRHDRAEHLCAVVDAKFPLTTCGGPLVRDANTLPMARPVSNAFGAVLAGPCQHIGNIPSLAI